MPRTFEIRTAKYTSPMALTQLFFCNRCGRVALAGCPIRLRWDWIQASISSLSLFAFQLPTASCGLPYYEIRLATSDIKKKTTAIPQISPASNRSLQPSGRLRSNKKPTIQYSNLLCFRAVQYITARAAMRRYAITAPQQTKVQFISLIASSARWPTLQGGFLLGMPSTLNS